MLPEVQTQGRRSRTYNKPPLSEAIYEFFADPSGTNQWSEESFARLAMLIRDFDAKEERLIDRDLIVNVQPSPNLGFNQQVSEPRVRLRRWNAEGTRAVQYGAHMCAYHVLPPYGHFEHHIPMIRNLLDNYLSRAQPERMAWTGQRAINIVRLPVAGPPAANYFEIYPKLPEALARIHSPLAVQVQTAEFENGSAVVNLALRLVEDGHAVYILDVYARSKDPMPANVDDLLAWQQRAHEALSASFELSITDDSRALFEVVS